MASSAAFMILKPMARALLSVQVFPMFCMNRKMYHTWISPLRSLNEIVLISLGHECKRMSAFSVALEASESIGSHVEGVNVRVGLSLLKLVSLRGCFMGVGHAVQERSLAIFRDSAPFESFSKFEASYEFYIALGSSLFECGKVSFYWQVVAAR